MRHGYYMVGFFDILGQGDRLREWGEISVPNRETVTPKLRETIGAVQRLRDIFEGFFTSSEAFATKIPPGDAKEFFNRTVSQQIRWWFSDTYVIAIPIMDKGDDAGLASAVGIYRTMGAASLAWLFGISSGHPVRGGIEIGLGVNITPNEVYGPVSYNAHYLESKVAKYPRIMVGETCVQFLRDTARRQLWSERHRSAADCAGKCLRLLCRKEDGHMLNVLGDDFLSLVRNGEPTFCDLFQPAHENVAKQLCQAAAVDNCERVERYRTLLSYFNEHATRWGGNPIRIERPIPA